MGTVSQVFLMNTEQFRHYWPNIEECLDLQPDLWNTAFTKPLIFDRVLNGQIQVWAVSDCDDINIVFMTQAYETPVTKILQVWWMMGSRLFPALPCIDAVLDKYAALTNCKMLEVVGRKGLERPLAHLGAKFLCATYARQVRPLTEN